MDGIAILADGETIAKIKLALQKPRAVFDDAEASEGLTEQMMGSR
jgi:hypothetical protein